MVKLSFDNIAEQFEQLSGCEAAQVAANIGIIENAQRRISALIDEKKCSARSIASAEYAAAAYAFYDYVCAQNAKENSDTHWADMFVGGILTELEITSTEDYPAVVRSGISGLILP